MTDPRIHERRVLVARQLGRRRRRRIVVAAVLVTLGLGGLALVHSSVFGAKNVEVSGDRHTPRAAVLRAAGLIGAPPLVDLDAAAIASRVDRLPWVASATVDISWPSTVSIRLKERVPVAAVQLAAGGFAICDPTGRVLEDVATRPPSLPLVATGGPVGPPGSSLAPAERELALVAADMPESMVRLSRVIVSSSEGAEVLLADGIKALVGSQASLTEKFVSLATVLHHGGLGGVAEIDLRVPSAPVLIR